MNESSKKHLSIASEAMKEIVHAMCLSEFGNEASSSVAWQAFSEKLKVVQEKLVPVTDP